MKPIIVGLCVMKVINCAYGREWIDSVAKYLDYAQENQIELSNKGFLQFAHELSNELDEFENQEVSSIKLPQPTVVVPQTESAKNQKQNLKNLSFPSKMFIDKDLLLHSKYTMNNNKSNSTKFTNYTSSSIVRFKQNQKILQIDSCMLVSKVSKIPNSYINDYHEPYKSKKSQLLLPKVNKTTPETNPETTPGYNFKTISKTLYNTSLSSMFPVPVYTPKSKTERNELSDERIYTLDYKNSGSFTGIRYVFSILFTFFNLII